MAGRLRCRLGNRLASKKRVVPHTNIVFVQLLFGLTCLAIGISDGGHKHDLAITAWALLPSNYDR